MNRPEAMVTGAGGSDKGPNSNGAEHPSGTDDGQAQAHAGSSNGSTPGAAGAAGAAARDDDSTRPGLGAAPRKVDVSHFPHYGLKRGMACTFCRRRKLKCSGDRPCCTNCVKYTKVCEYGPPVKETRKQSSANSITSVPSAGSMYDAGDMPHPGAMHAATPLSELSRSSLYNAQPGYDYFPTAVSPRTGLALDASLMAPSAMTSNSIGPYQATPFDLMQQSPFVATPPHPQTPIAQPIIGMPPYAQPPGFGGYNNYADPNAAVQQQQWFTPGCSVPPMTPATPLNQSTFGPGTVGLPETPVQPNAINSAVDPQFMYSLPSASISRLPSDASTPEDGHTRATGTGESMGVDTPGSSRSGRPLASSMYRQTASLHYVADVTAVDGLTERLGEFLFSPHGSAVNEDESLQRRRNARKASGRPPSPASIARMGKEYDGLLDASRSLLLDCFLAHATLFFEMSVPRFRYRMTFSDRRRPSLALLNAMYLWATRISNSPQMSSMEKHFYELAVKHLDASTSTVDRLIDAVRAAMLLSAYSHSSGRHHEGWCLAGHAIRLVLSCGLHRIPSMVHKPEPMKNPFLRNRIFLLPPAEDAVELGERIHAFWAVFAIDRCGSIATGYPAGFRDEDITTPFGRSLTDICSGAVSERDDMTVRDLYRGASSDNDTPYTKWVKCVAILERSTKMCFLEPAEDSPYALAWNQYSLTVHRDPLQAKPPEYLNQPKYRTPRDYRECLLAVEQLVNNIGDEGVFPVVRRMHAEQDGAPEPIIPTSIIMLHHLIAAVHMALHDINSIDVENPEALKAARKSVLLFRAMPQIPFTDVDSFVVLVWSMIAKVLIKEIHRLSVNGDAEGARGVALEADTIIDEMSRIGQTMYLARTQAKAVDELKRAALAAGDTDAPSEGALPQLETFMFPQPM